MDDEITYPKSKKTIEMEAFYDAVNSDQEPWRKKGYQIIDGLFSGNVELLLAMLCGWGGKSLAKKAMIIRDKCYEFHEQEMKGRLIVYWSNGQKTTSKCLIDVATHGVWNYSPHAFTKHKKENAEIEKTCVQVAPVEGGQKYEFHCISRKERDRLRDDDVYWYTPEPQIEPYNYED